MTSNRNDTKSGPSFKLTDSATLRCPFKPSDDKVGKHRASCCPFGHDTQTKDGSPRVLRPIPANFCVDHLAGRCQQVVSDIASKRTNHSQVYKCRFGFHPADLADFDRMVVAINEKAIQIGENLGAMESNYGNTAQDKDLHV